MAKAKATKKSKKAAAKQTRTVELDGKLVELATDLRKQGATAAIIEHTLVQKHGEVNYNMAKRLAEAADKKIGHPLNKVVRTADEIKLNGYTVRDGRQEAKPKAAPKAAPKKAAKASAKTVNGNGKAKANGNGKLAGKPADRPVARPAVTA